MTRLAEITIAEIITRRNCELEIIVTDNINTVMGAFKKATNPVGTRKSATQVFVFLGTGNTDEKTQKVFAIQFHNDAGRATMRCPTIFGNHIFRFIHLRSGSLPRFQIMLYSPSQIGSFECRISVAVYQFNMVIQGHASQSYDCHAV